jgi:hypothetical protein
MTVMELLTVMVSFTTTRSMCSVELNSQKSTFPLSKMVQPMIMLDGFPTFTSISFKSFKLILLLKEIDVKVGNPSNIIIGCTILDNGKVLFCEFNSTEHIDRVTLNDSNGNFIRTVQWLSPHDVSFYDTTSLLISSTPTSPIEFTLIMSPILAENIIILRFNFPSLPNFSTLFSSSCALET